MGLHPFDPRVVASAFGEALAKMTPGPVAIVAHHDADGLSAAALLARALAQAGRVAPVRIVGKGEGAWDKAVRADVRAHDPAGVLVLDLGVRRGDPVPGVPAVIIDHHRPQGVPGASLVLSGHGLDPEPCTALIAWWAAHALADPEPLLWLAAIGAAGDMVDPAAFPELARAHARGAKTAIAKAASLINAPRRTAAADARPALNLLLKAASPKAVLSGEHGETALLQAARIEVQAELDRAKRIAPTVRGPVALIRLDSPAQIHPLIAQQWRGRLKDRIVLAANTGYRSGWVHFAARTATGTDLLAFLAERRPPSAGEEYGGGHVQATGGALRPPAWNAFAAALGFPEAQVPA